VRSQFKSFQLPHSLKGSFDVPGGEQNPFVVAANTRAHVAEARRRVALNADRKFDDKGFIEGLGSRPVSLS
jgi:hypothetical protein